jgi:hypothetical protein
VPFTQASEPLKDLLREFSPTAAAVHPEYPFYLQNDGLWQRHPPLAVTPARGRLAPDSDAADDQNDTSCTLARVPQARWPPAPSPVGRGHVVAGDGFLRANVRSCGAGVLLRASDSASARGFASRRSWHRSSTGERGRTDRVARQGLTFFT